MSQCTVGLSHQPLPSALLLLRNRSCAIIAMWSGGGWCERPAYRHILLITSHVKYNCDGGTMNVVIAPTTVQQG